MNASIIILNLINIIIHNNYKNNFKKHGGKPKLNTNRNRRVDQG